MSSSAQTATRQRAARDVLMQIVFRVMNLALGVFVTALVARTLGSRYYGQWSTIFVVLGIVGYLASFGMENVVVREAAARPETEFQWFGAMMSMRLILLGPAILSSGLAVLLLQRDHQMLIAGLILIVALPFDGIGVVQLVFRLRVNNLVPMLVLTLKSLLWGGAVVIIYLNEDGMVALAVAMAATNAVGSVVQTIAAYKLLGRWPRPSRTHLGTLVRIGIPLGLSGVLITSYARIDQVIVYSVAGSRDAGLYGAVYGILDQAHFVPISVLTTLSPIIAAAWGVDRARMLRAVALTAEMLAVASFGALAFVTIAAKPVVLAIFGPDFADAAPALPVLAAAFVFICFGYLNGTVLTVLGLQRRLLDVSLAALVFNLAGNAVFVPLDGFMGAAIVTLLTEVLVCGLSVRLILRGLELPFPGLGRGARTVAAALVLLGALALARLASDSLWLLVPTACLLYPALLFGLRAIAIDDLRVLIKREVPV